MIFFLIVVQIIVSLLLILAILMQSSDDNEGSGGFSITNNLGFFKEKNSNTFLNKITIFLGILFMFLNILQSSLQYSNFLSIDRIFNT